MLTNSVYYLPYDPDLSELASKLRKNMTLQEKKLWFEYLNLIDTKFYRQKVILRYIVDFYSPEYKLAIELDGSQHLSKPGLESDTERDLNLKGLGIKVLRFSNFQIDNSFLFVCESIANHLKPNS